MVFIYIYLVSLYLYYIILYYITVYYIILYLLHDTPVSRFPFDFNLTSLMPKRLPRAMPRISPPCRLCAT